MSDNHEAVDSTGQSSYQGRDVQVVISSGRGEDESTASRGCAGRGVLLISQVMSDNHEEVDSTGERLYQDSDV